MSVQRQASSLPGGLAKDSATTGLSGAFVAILNYHSPGMPVEVAIAYVTIGAVVFGLLRRAIEELLARRGSSGGPRAGAISLVALAAILSACGTTPTDRYYSALSTLAGVRQSAIEACRLEAVPVDRCQSIHDEFFIPGDAAVAVAENARLSVISACAEDESSSDCKGAGANLRAAAAAAARIAADLTQVLATYGVKTR